MIYAFVCSWPHDEKKGGLVQYEMNPQTGELTYIRTLNEEVSFGTVFVDQESNMVFALNEDKNPKGGLIYNYRLNPKNGDIALAGITQTFCPNTAYLGIHPGKKYAIAANHSFYSFATKVEKDTFGNYHAVEIVNDATVNLYEINDDGTLGKLVDVVKHTKTSVAKKQNMSHPHCAVFNSDGTMCAVCDKGSDYVYMYTINKNEKKLDVVTIFKEKPGYKPRYAVFHPTKPFFYHNNEGNAFICAYKYDQNAFIKIGEYSALKETFGCERVEQQGLAIHPNGKFLYDVVRGPMGVAVFSINEETGELTLIQTCNRSELEWIRGIAISPSGKIVCVSFMDSDKVVTYKVNDDGKLESTGFECTQVACAGIAFWSDHIQI